VREKAVLENLGKKSQNKPVIIGNKISTNGLILISELSGVRR